MRRLCWLAAILASCATVMTARADVGSWDDFLNHPDTVLVDSGSGVLDPGAPVTTASLEAYANDTLDQYAYAGSFWEGYAPTNLFFSVSSADDIRVLFWDFRVQPGVSAGDESSEFQAGHDVLMSAFGGDQTRFLLESPVVNDTQGLRLIVEFPDWLHLETGAYWNVMLDEDTGAFLELEVNFESFLQVPEPASAFTPLCAAGLLAVRRHRPPAPPSQRRQPHPDVPPIPAAVG